MSACDFDSHHFSNCVHTSYWPPCYDGFPSPCSCPHIMQLLLFQSLFSSCSVCAGRTVIWPNTHTHILKKNKAFHLCRRDGCHLSVSTRSNCSERLEWKGNSNTNTLCFAETHLLPRCSTNGYLCPFLSVWTSPPLPPLVSLSSTT